MKRLLKLYFYRLLHEKAFWIIFGILGLAGIVTGWVVGSAYVRSLDSHSYSLFDTYGLGYYTVMGLSFNFSASSLATIVNGGIPAIVGAYLQLGFWGLIVITLFVGREWKEKTFRNQILAGQSRLSIYLSSLIVCLVIAVANLLVFEALMLVTGSLFGTPFFTANELSHTANLVGKFAISITLLFLIYLMMACAATSWSYIIPNSWGALGLFYASCLALLISVIVVDDFAQSHLLPLYLLENFLPGYQAAKLMVFDYDTAVTSYVDVGGGQYVYYQAVSTAGHAVPFILTTIFSNLLYAAGMTFLGCLSFIKRDLK